jgi:3-oxoacyl-[acyl-carrier protein] reductase
MRHREYALAGVHVGKAEECWKDARAQLVVRLAAGPASVPVGGSALRVALLDLVHGQALPVADVDLAQRLEGSNVELQSGGHDRRGLARPSQRARVHGAEALARENVCELRRLGTPGLVERSVGVALEAMLSVPVGLAVPDQDDGRRHGDTVERVDLGLAGKRCLVSGSTGGIGLEVVRQLASEDGLVVSCGRRDAPNAGEVAHVVADLSRPGEPERAVAESAAALGGLDVLVNNVGVARQARFEDVQDEEWDEYWQLNVMSYVRCIRGALPHLRTEGGAIVNVSSTAGKRPSTGMPHYSVTKAAVLSLSRLVADLYAGDGIRCNAVTPGPTATDAWLGEGGLADQQGDREEVLARVGAGRPLGRLARAEEIAAVIVFLCSERASYVTGAAWSADGGTVPIIL